jgi:hypothetical protein
MSVNPYLAIDDFHLGHLGLIPRVDGVWLDGDERLFSQLRGRGAPQKHATQNDSEYSHTDSLNVGNLRVARIAGKVHPLGGRLCR